jgi:hypothetical protein
MEAHGCNVTSTRHPAPQLTQPASKEQAMTTLELLSMMRLLSAMESAMLMAGKSLPDHILDDVGRHVEILEREILERTKQ